MDNILGQPSADVIECPSPLSEVCAKRMSEIVKPDDMPQWMHPAFQATVYEFPHSRDIVDPYLSFGCVPLFTFAPEKDCVQFHEIQIFECLLRPGCAESIESRIKPLQMCLEQHNASGREVLRDDDFGEGAISVEALRRDNGRNFGNPSR